MRGVKVFSQAKSLIFKDLVNHRLGRHLNYRHDLSIIVAFAHSFR